MRVGLRARACALSGACALLSSLVAPRALAERGLFTASLQAGQVVEVAPAPGAGRGVPLLGTLQYGFTERWSVAAAGALEFSPEGVALALLVGPRLRLFRDYWWTVEASVTPEASWLPQARRFDFGIRLSGCVRYLMLWGLGLVLEGGVRGRVDAVGPFAPALKAYVVGGLYFEA